MDYIPFTPETALVDLRDLQSSAILCLTIIMAFSVASILPIISKEWTMRKRVFLFLASVMLVVFGVIGLVSSFSISAEQKNAYKEERADWYVEVSDSFTEYYGVKVTPDDVSQLWYPEAEPSEKEYYEKTTISTGPEASSFKEVTLSITDGKAYLLTQTGAEYEELSPVVK